MFDQELDREPYEPPHTEITLSNTTLLLIFFGAVLVCGLFFGLGFSMGRRGSAPPLAPVADSGADNTSQPASISPASTTKHSAGQAVPPPPAKPARSESEPTDEAATPSSEPSPKSAHAAQPETAAPTAPAKTAAPEASRAATTEAPAAPTGKTWLVQVAAVTHEEDANALASALRKKGYAVETHPGADKLFRVQLGPYPTQKEAAAERDKLVDDGYMAVVK